MKYDLGGGRGIVKEIRQPLIVRGGTKMNLY